MKVICRYSRTCETRHGKLVISPMQLQICILIGATWINLTPKDAEELYGLLHKALFLGLAEKKK